MKRWGIGFLLVLLSCVPLLLSRATAAAILDDSDTKELLRVIRVEQDPLSWFVGDWPLRNHFYRPISTLTFEIDNALYGTNAAGYGLTNVLLAIGCILALFWVVRELTDSVPITTGTCVLFALWHVNWQGPLVTVALGGAVVAGVGGLFRHGFRLKFWWAAPLVWVFIAEELWPVADQMDTAQGVMQWLPGRTASTMCLFALIAVAAYARYERLSAARVLPEVTPLDPPATKGTRQGGLAPRGVWVWPLVSMVALVLCLGAYEQAVMVPALLLSAAVALKLQGYLVRWGWQVAFWAALVGYLVLRKVLLPEQASGYQLQALRSGPGVMMDLASYALPAYNHLPGMQVTLEFGLVALTLPTFWNGIVAIASNAATVVKSAPMWRLVLPPYVMSILAFLPMAWLNPFDHYHYMPMAFRALFVCTVIVVGLRALATAVSPPVRQAPPRLDPAPGWLPRP